MIDQFSNDGDGASGDDFYAAYARAEGALCALKGLRDLLSEAGELAEVNREGIFALLGMPIDALEDALGRMLHLAIPVIVPKSKVPGIPMDAGLIDIFHRAERGVPLADSANPRDRELHAILSKAKPTRASDRRKYEDRLKKQKHPKGGAWKSGNGDAPAA